MPLPDHRRNRRNWLKQVSVTAGSLGLAASAGPLADQARADQARADQARAGADATTDPLETFVPVRPITRGPAHHWFGYYDKREFSSDGRFVLSNEVAFEGRAPTGDDAIGVGMVDTQNGDRWIPLGTSKAWSWQQGCMLQWVGRDDRFVIWNDRENGRFVSKLYDRDTSSLRTLGRAIYTLLPDGKSALAVDFSRLDNLRPGYGYDGLQDAYAADPAPEASGIWKVDLETGQEHLVFSLAQAAALPWPGSAAPPKNAWHYFNHLLVNPAGTRFIVLHRYRPKFDPKTLRYDGGFVTRMLTVDIDGGRKYVLDPGGKTSHFIWKNDEVVTLWTRPIGKQYGFYDFWDRSEKVVAVGKKAMPANGHNTYLEAPYSDWILNDTYPSKPGKSKLPSAQKSLGNRQTVYLYHVPSKRRFDLGHFPSPPAYRGQWRCDTHPRGGPGGTQVAIDSPHDGGRQVYLLDIADLLRKHLLPPFVISSVPSVARLSEAKFRVARLSEAKTKKRLGEACYFGETYSPGCRRHGRL
ncbi:MAG: hypothetical protein AAF958_15475 [Planctomycetota bacterium]